MCDIVRKALRKKYVKCDVSIGDSFRKKVSQRGLGSHRPHGTRAGLTSLLYRREHQLHPPLALLWGKRSWYALVTRVGRGGGGHSLSGGYRQKRVAPVPLLVAGNVVNESAFPNLIWPSELFVMREKSVDVTN